MVTENIFSKTLSKVKIFENAGFSFHVDGQKRKFSYTMTSYIIKFYYYNIAHALWGVLSYFHCLAFSYGRTKWFEYATCGHVYFWNWLEKISGLKNIQIHVDLA